MTGPVAGPRRRRFLVVVRAGDTSLHPTWVDPGRPRSFDLVVSYYGRDPQKYRDGPFPRIDDPGQSQAMAARFDDMFANSSAETKTTTEKGFVEGFAKQVGDIGTIMIAIVGAVLFTMLLVAANTMAQSVRERTNEVGVLKTLGFSSGQILALVLGESLLIALIGGAAGLGVAWLIVQQGDPTNGMLPVFMLPPRDVALGGDLVVLLGLVAGAWPAATAMQLKITDALRRS